MTDRTEIPVTDITRDGPVRPARVVGDPTNGMWFGGNDGKTFLEITNDAAAGSWSVGADVSARRDVDDIAVPDKEVIVNAGGTVYFGPFPARYYSQTYLDDTTAVLINPEAGSGHDLKFIAFQVDIAEVPT